MWKLAQRLLPWWQSPRLVDPSFALPGCSVSWPSCSSSVKRNSSSSSPSSQSYRSMRHFMVTPRRGWKVCFPFFPTLWASYSRQSFRWSLYLGSSGDLGNLLHSIWEKGSVIEDPNKKGGALTHKAQMLVTRARFGLQILKNRLQESNFTLPGWSETS